MIVSMDGKGTVNVGYLGTEVTQLRVAPKNGRTIDYEAMEEEMSGLYKQIHELTKGIDVRLEHSLPQSLHIRLPDDHRSSSVSAIDINVTIELAGGSPILHVHNGTPETLRNVCLSVEHVPGFQLRDYNFQIAELRMHGVEMMNVTIFPNTNFILHLSIGPSSSQDVPLMLVPSQNNLATNSVNVVLLVRKASGR